MISMQINHVSSGIYDSMLAVDNHPRKVALMLLSVDITQTEKCFCYQWKHGVLTDGDGVSLEIIAQ